MSQFTTKNKKYSYRSVILRIDRLALWKMSNITLILALIFISLLCSCRNKSNEIVPKSIDTTGINSHLPDTITSNYCNCNTFKKYTISNNLEKLKIINELSRSIHNNVCREYKNNFCILNPLINDFIINDSIADSIYTNIIDKIHIVGEMKYYSKMEIQLPEFNNLNIIQKSRYDKIYRKFLIQ